MGRSVLKRQEEEMFAVPVPGPLPLEPPVGRYQAPTCTLRRCPSAPRAQRTTAALESFTVITTAACSRLADIHHWQPAIIDPNRFADWLDPSSPATRLLDLVHEPLGPPLPGSAVELLIDSITAHSDGYSLSCSSTIRTARSRTSGARSSHDPG